LRDPLFMQTRSGGKAGTTALPFSTVCPTPPRGQTDEELDGAGGPGAIPAPIHSCIRWHRPWEKRQTRAPADNSSVKQVAIRSRINRPSHPLAVAPKRPI